MKITCKYLLALCLIPFFLIDCAQKSEPSTSGFAGIYTSRCLGLLAELTQLRPDSSYMEFNRISIAEGTWTVRDSHVWMKEDYTMEDNGYIRFYALSGVPFESLITDTIPDTVREDEVFFPSLIFYTDGRSSESYKYAYKTEYFYKDVPQHRNILRKGHAKFLRMLPDRPVRFTCRVEDYPRLDGIQARGVLDGIFPTSAFDRNLSFVKRGSSYLFRFRECRRSTDPCDTASAPMWYECRLPYGISDFLAMDKGDMFFLYGEDSAVWLHCGPEAEGHAPGPSDTASYLIARNFPAASDSYASALLGVIRERLLVGPSVVAGSERGFAIAGGIPRGMEELFSLMLSRTFKTSPSVMLKYVNSLMYTPHEWIIDSASMSPNYRVLLDGYNGYDRHSLARSIDTWNDGSKKCCYDWTWRDPSMYGNTFPVTVPCRSHASGIYREDYTGLREIVVADGLVLPVRCKSADMSDASSVLFHIRPDTLWCRVPQLADRFCNTALRRSASVPDLGYDYEQYVIDSFETRGSGNGFREVNRHASRYMVKMGLDPDRVIYEVYSSVGVPVACDFWKLGKRDIGSYGLRRDGDSLVITIRLREK